MLYTFKVTVDVQDDTEAGEIASRAVEMAEGRAEVVEWRWFRDLDAEAGAALAGVRWGGR